MALPAYDSYTGITPEANAWLWTVFAVMAVTALAIWALSFTRAPEYREFHYITLIINATAALAYLCMALGVGNVQIGANQRTFTIQRYLDWMVTTPLLLIDLCLLAGQSLTTIFGIVALDELMIIAGLLGDMTDSKPGMWALFAFSMAAYLPIIYYLVEDAHLVYTVHTFGWTAANNYRFIVFYLLSIWTLYPLAWVLYRAEVIGNSGTILFYGVLDVLAKPVYSALILASNPHPRGEPRRTKAGPLGQGYPRHQEEIAYPDSGEKNARAEEFKA